MSGVIATLVLCTSLILSESVASAGTVRAHVTPALGLQVEAWYNYAIRWQYSTTVTNVAINYTIVCDGTHTSATECQGGRLGYQLAFTKNGSNQWVLTGSIASSLVTSSYLTRWTGLRGLANGQSYTMSLSQTGTTAPTPVTFTVGDGGRPTNVTISNQAAPDLSADCTTSRPCSNGTQNNVVATGSTITVSWTKPAHYTVPGELSGVWSGSAPVSYSADGYIVAVLPTKFNSLSGYGESLATPNASFTIDSATIHQWESSSYTGTTSNLWNPQMQFVSDGCQSYDSNPQYLNDGQAGSSWWVQGIDTTTVTLKNCHFARDESYKAYVMPYWENGVGQIFKNLDPTRVPYDWDLSKGVVPMTEIMAYWSSWTMNTSTGKIDSEFNFPTGVSSAVPADGQAGNLVPQATNVTDVVAAPASLTDPNLKGALRISWTAPTADTYSRPRVSTDPMTPIVRYRVIAFGNLTGWNAYLNLYDVNNSSVKELCDTTATSCVVEGFAAWTSYTIRVLPENSKSRGGVLTMANGTYGAGGASTNWPLSPSEPLNLLATSPSSTTTKLSWQPPLSVGGPAGVTISKYTAWLYPNLTVAGPIDTGTNGCGQRETITNQGGALTGFSTLYSSTRNYAVYTSNNWGNSLAGGRTDYAVFTIAGQRSDGTFGCIATEPALQFKNSVGRYGSYLQHTVLSEQNGFIFEYWNGGTKLDYVFVPKVADDDPRLSGVETANASVSIGGIFYMPFSYTLVRGGPDFAKAVILAKATDSQWSNYEIRGIRTLDASANTFLVLASAVSSTAQTTNKFFKLTVNGSTVTTDTTPVKDLGCIAVQAELCSTLTLGNNVAGANAPPITDFAINPVSKNIYFSLGLPAVGGWHTMGYVSTSFMRMTYDATSGTWAAPATISFDGGTYFPQSTYYGQGSLSSLNFTTDGVLQLSYVSATCGRLCDYYPNQTDAWTETSAGFVLQRNTGVPYTSWDWYQTPKWFQGWPSWGYVRTPSGMILAYIRRGIGTPTDSTTWQYFSSNLGYVLDTHAHKCEVTTGNPVETSCVFGTGSDPYPTVAGQSYTYNVYATNVYFDGTTKDGPLSKSGTFLAGGPDAPTLKSTQITGTAANPTLNVVFTPSKLTLSDADDSVTSYTCTLYNTSGGVVATKTVTPPSPISVTTELNCSFTAADGISNTSSYVLSVTATNPVGTSAPATASLITIAAPIAPSPVSGSTTGSVTTVTYTPKGTGVTTVEIIDPATNQAVPGAICVGATVTSPSCTVNGLTPGKTYTLKACTSNSLAVSPACTTTSYTVPYGIPDKPVVTTAPSDQKIKVSWPTPPNNGSVITGYTVTVSPGGGTGCTGLSASATSCELTGLTNGTEYLIEVTVNYTTNGVAGSTKVATLVADTPLVAPDVPSAPVAVATGASTATVTYTPTNDNGTTVDSYTFYAYDTSGNIIVPNLTCTAVAPATSCEFANLTEGTTYKFGVVANFRSPSGGYTSTDVSLLSNEVTPTGVVTAPSAPRNVDAQPADHSAVISWQAPSSNGGAPITSYTVQAYDASGNAVAGATCTVAAPALTCIVDGLLLNTSYTFKVIATNEAGDSPESSASPSITPEGVDPTAPGPVLNGAATGTSHTVTVTWDAPDTGDVPTRYEVSIPGQTTCVIDLVANPNAALSCTFTGLTNGTSYTATIVAKNDVGPSTSVTVSATPYGTPSAPTISSTSATTNNDGVIVRLGAPSDNGGSSVTGYTVIAYNASGQQVGTCTTATLTCTVTGLTAGVPYTFKATATTARATSAQSAPRSFTIPTGYQKVNAYIRGYSYAAYDLDGARMKQIRATVRAIIAGNNTRVVVKGFANFTATKRLSRNRASTVADYMRELLAKAGRSDITVTTVFGGNTAKFGGTVMNRVVYIQGR